MPQTPKILKLLKRTALLLRPSANCPRNDEKKWKLTNYIPQLYYMAHYRCEALHDSDIMNKNQSYYTYIL